MRVATGSASRYREQARKEGMFMATPDRDRPLWNRALELVKLFVGALEPIAKLIDAISRLLH